MMSGTRFVLFVYANSMSRLWFVLSAYRDSTPGL